MIVTRDLVCLVLGVWGLVVEELSGKADLGRMAFFALLIIAPGLWAAAWLGRSGTEQQSSPPPSEPSPSSSSSPGQ